MSEKVAKFISVMLHPAWVPLLISVAVFHYCPFLVLTFEPVKNYIFLLIAIFTFAAPIVSSILLLKSGHIKNLQMPERSERPLPLLIAAVYHCILTYFFITKLEGIVVLSAMLLSVSFTLVLLTIINTYQKISIHTAGFSGAIGFFMSLRLLYPNYAITQPLIIALLCCGLVMSARLSLKAHTPSEVWNGFGIGFSSCFTINLAFLVYGY